MVWPDLTYEPEATSFDQRTFSPPDPVAFDHDVFAWYKKVIELRHAHPSLRRGSVVHISTGHDGVFAFRRTLGNDTLVVVINREATEKPLVLGLSGEWRDRLSGSDGVPASLAPRSGIVLSRK
jgi:glycosidase